jgi:peptidoglycan/LPS O-acetylase OafA/YrhL
MSSVVERPLSSIPAWAGSNAPRAPDESEPSAHAHARHYRPDIDGLRALAVVPVVLFHAHIDALSGGFVGVDVFFVISGYLICSLIGAELTKGNFSILRFYERRCRRILPALLAMFAMTAVLGVAVLMPPDLSSLGASLLTSLLFTSNIYFWKTSGYFDGAAESKPLLHTWSLSVEEQFYLFVPYILMATAAFYGKRYVRVLVPLAVASFALSQWAVERAPSAAFFMLPTRFWEMALGGIIGLGVTSAPQRRWLREAIAALGLGCILFAVVTYSEFTPFPGLAAVLPCGGAALIIYAGTGGVRSVVGSLLTRRPCLFVGQISYSLYLWHWPLLVLYRYQLGRALTLGQVAGALALAGVVSALSWRFIERPFRVGASSLTTRAVFRGAAWGALAAALFGGAALATDGLPERFPGYASVNISAEAQFDTAGRGECFLLDGKTVADWGGDTCYVTRGKGPTVVLWGDSFAAHYVPGIQQLASRARVDILQYTMSACPAVFAFDSLANPPCQAFNQNVRAVLREYGARAVIVSARWDYALRRQVTPEQIGATLSELRDQGVEVHFIGQSPLFGNDVQVLFAQAGGTTQRPEGSGYVTFDTNLNHVLASVAPARVAFIDPLEQLCRLPECLYRRDGKFIFFDDGHLTTYGSGLSVDRYFPFVD